MPTGNDLLHWVVKACHEQSKANPLIPAWAALGFLHILSTLRIVRKAASQTISPAPAKEAGGIRCPRGAQEWVFAPRSGAVPGGGGMAAAVAPKISGTEAEDPASMRHGRNPPDAPIPAGEDVCCGGDGR